MDFFNTQNYAPYNTMKPYLIGVHSITEGIERVKRGNFAFMTDTAILDYYKNQYCTVMTVGEEFLVVSYALGLSSNSPYTREISAALLKLRINGYIKKELQKWLVFLVNYNGNKTFYADIS